MSLGAFIQIHVYTHTNSEKGKDIYIVIHKNCTWLCERYIETKDSFLKIIVGYFCYGLWVISFLIFYAHTTINKKRGTNIW